MNNPFSNPAFSMTALTAAINILPNQIGRASCRERVSSPV